MNKPFLCFSAFPDPENFPEDRRKKFRRPDDQYFHACRSFPGRSVLEQIKDAGSDDDDGFYDDQKLIRQKKRHKNTGSERQDGDPDGFADGGFESVHDCIPSE